MKKQKITRGLKDLMADRMENLADRMENPRAEAEDLRKYGLGRYFIKRIMPMQVAEIMFLATTVGIAALAGEVMDHIPYISKAIPEVLEELTNSEYFHGNLDKLGATLGFVGNYLKRR